MYIFVVSLLQLEVVECTLYFARYACLLPVISMSISRVSTERIGLLYLQLNVIFCKCCYYLLRAKMHYTGQIVALDHIVVKTQNYYSRMEASKSKLYITTEELECTKCFIINLSIILV